MPADLAVGVIGAGRIGRLHAENLARHVPAARLAAVADPRLALASAAAAACPGARAVQDARLVLEDPGIQAVIVASTTDTHADLIVAAAGAGKHVFCEKPLDLDPARAAAAISAAEAAGVRLQVGFNRRFDPNFRHLAERLHRGEIGSPHLVRITSRDPQPPPLEYVRTSGGLFLDMAIHDLDMARFLVADEVVEVYATGSALVDPQIATAGDVDTAVIVLRYRGGALCTIDDSRRAVYGYDQRLEVFGAGGCLFAGNDTPTCVQLWDESGQHAGRPYSFFLERYRDSYVAEMRDFVAGVRQGRAVSVTGRDGLRALELGLAARRSCALGRPVQIETPQEPPVGRLP